ncbi:hypothetical protein [Sporohalobacter salinus]|uniref:hypothetical protein n=1 Tax=Sporohalobacter salinus TaxID=1494606 RepID=UPI001960D7C9|nr:hypothetical protein [Sporohalobacter salinus]MBM7624594.1 uncharacterized membrane protein (DUF373 family) [Sporohalobacter salinus]
MWLEAVLSIFIMGAVLIGFIDLAKYINVIFSLSPQNAYEYFQNFLSHTLLLVIGLEMIIMLIQHTPGSVVEVLIFGIARKVLIHSDNMIDLVLGVIALAGLFAVKKYLLEGNGGIFIGENIDRESTG